MPPANTAPSLLSRLSPLPIDSRQSPQYVGSTVTSPSTRQRPEEAFLSTSTTSSQSHSLSKSQTSRASPRKPKYGGGQNTHLSSLPDEVLQRGLPIPASRSTNSSRWASSPPSAAAASRAHPVKKGFSPLIRPVDPAGSSPPPITASSTSPSTSPALQQIETMLSQLRTTTGASPTKSVPSSSPGIRAPIASLSPSKVSASPTTTKTLLSSSRSPVRPDSFPLTSPSMHRGALDTSEEKLSTLSSRRRGAADAVKRPALGGKSRWARDSDEEPEPVRFGSIDKGASNGLAGQSPARAERSDPQSRAARIAPGAGEGATRHESEFEPSRTANPHDGTAEVSPAIAPSSPALEADHEVAPFHIDWADDDDDDALPDLHDWGVTTEPPSYASRDDDVVETSAAQVPLSPTLSSTSTVSNRSKRHRRRNSTTDTNHQHPLPPWHNHQHQQPPPQRVQPPLPAPAALHRTGPTTQARQPPKPVPNRLFNSARAAALPPPSASAPAIVTPAQRRGFGLHHPDKQLPPHQQQQQQPKHRTNFDSSSSKPVAAATMTNSNPAPGAGAAAGDPLESNWRAKGVGPSPALFSKLSGMGGASGANGSGGLGGKSSGGADGVGGGGSNSRRSRRGRSRTSSAAGAGAGGATPLSAPSTAAAASNQHDKKKTKPPLSPPAAATIRETVGGAGEEGAWTKVGAGGKSRWA
ncbi:hypothetical protein JCM3766R1_002329 [Sporobolomyces carnicolor]